MFIVDAEKLDEAARALVDCLDNMYDMQGLKIKADLVGEVAARKAAVMGILSMHRYADSVIASDTACFVYLDDSGEFTSVPPKAVRDRIRSHQAQERLQMKTGN